MTPTQIVVTVRSGRTYTLQTPDTRESAAQQVNTVMLSSLDEAGVLRGPDADGGFHIINVRDIENVVIREGDQ